MRETPRLILRDPRLAFWRESCCAALACDRNAPVWFREGVAEYLAMTLYEESSDEVTFGTVDMQTLRLVAYHGLYPWSGLWTWPANPIERFRTWRRLTDPAARSCGKEFGRLCGQAHGGQDFLGEVVSRPNRERVLRQSRECGRRCVGARRSRDRPL